jgi:hypothetical protein
MRQKEGEEGRNAQSPSHPLEFPQSLAGSWFLFESRAVRAECNDHQPNFPPSGKRVKRKRTKNAPCLPYSRNKAGLRSGRKQSREERAVCIVRSEGGGGGGMKGSRGMKEARREGQGDEHESR